MKQTYYLYKTDFCSVRIVAVVIRKWYLALINGLNGSLSGRLLLGRFPAKSNCYVYKWSTARSGASDWNVFFCSTAESSSWKKWWTDVITVSSRCWLVALRDHFMGRWIGWIVSNDVLSWSAGSQLSGGERRWGGETSVCLLNRKVTFSLLTKQTSASYFVFWHYVSPLGRHTNLPLVK